MTLVGKIFVVAILVMSVVYMGFALMVYAQHRNWRDIVERTAAGNEPGQELGLKFQIQNLEEQKKKLVADLELNQTKLAAETADKERRLAQAQEELVRLRAIEVAAKTQVDELQKENRALTGAINTTQQHLTTVIGEVQALRTDIVSTQQLSDSNFNKFVSQADDLHQAHGQLVRVEERLNQLKNDLVQQKTPPDASAPKVDGVITAVASNNLIEISIGSDDGIKVGHSIDVYRGSNYVGRAEILRTAPDKAVAKFNLIKTPPQKDDRVATQLRAG